MVVQRCLGPPADVEGTMDMALAPLHDLTELIPVFHLLELQKLDGRTSNDHPIVISVSNILKCLVKGDHVLLGGMCRLMAAGLQKLQLDLQRRVSKQSGELCLRIDLGGHQVQ